MKRRLGVLLVAAALMSGCGGAGRAPAGQPPLLNLTAANFTALPQAFNAASGEVRVLLLLSPT